MKRQAFGRRTVQSTCSHAAGPQAVSRGDVCAEPVASPGHESSAVTLDSLEDHSIDEELREWKNARRKMTKLPWRQISLMASLCFGIGSFVLPDAVNHAVQWPLLGLAALSLFAGFSKARQPGEGRQE
ncbi:MAG TPA: hypothetical protein VHX18_02805 [Rhizomicrobium sp.]|jgi:hypothetical protein|nr:hypothetical protein [Rhizomicrobium sp.]